MIAHATGMQMDKQRLWKTFQRIRTLVRAVNVRRGLRRKDERPPEDHWAVRDERYEQELLSKYYDFKGWNSEGIPTRQTLEALDLAYAADDLERRGPVGRCRHRRLRAGDSGELDSGRNGRVAVKADVTTKTVKEIRIDIEKCTGCRACEMACSAFHAKPRYSSINPARSRIRVVTDEINDEYVPVRAGNFTRSECDGEASLPLKRQAVQ